MTCDDAAAYYGLLPSTWDRWVSDGRMPPPVPGTHRSDRKAIDLAWDRLAGIATAVMDASDAELWPRGGHREGEGAGRLNTTPSEIPPVLAGGAGREAGGPSLSWQTWQGILPASHESLNGRLRDKCLNEHLFRSLPTARTLIEAWRVA